jgi:DNA-binding GntR family transcriptional regulator
VEDARDSLAGFAHGEIKRRILTAELPRGTRLSVEALAHELSVSAAPIKEALKQLEREGLIEIKPRSGTIVRSFSREDVANIYGARKIVEPAAAALVAQKGPAPPALMQGLEQSMVTLHVAISKGVLARDIITDTDSLFHRLIVAAAGNGVLSEIHATLIDRARLLRHYARRQGRSEAAMAEHRRIIAALQRGDAEDATAASFAHLDAAEHSILSAMDAED